MTKRVVLGDRPPSYPSKATLAAELDLSESTIDSYVQRGFLPKPFTWGGSVRWNWAEVTAHRKAQATDDQDRFMAGLDNV
jgi:predicted DNA-binding transcriptional regulator AlpA